MCIAILNTKGTTLKKDTLNNCWVNNGDGAGILYIDDNKKLGVFKEMNSFENFYKNYIEIKQKYGKRNIVLHFRISTHGRVNETNCHPFITNDDIGFVHNGMIYDVPESLEYSDTYMFNESILKNLKPGFEYNETILGMLEAFIGSGSKLIFLNKENEFFIVNERAGHWNLGCWFSNTSYQQVNNWYDFGGTRKYKSTPSTGYTWGANSNWGAKDKTYSSSVFNEEEEGEFATNMCTDCGWMLVTEAEMKNGVCEFCEHENHAQDDLCGLCQENEATELITEFNASVCKTCKTSLGA